MRVFVLEDDPMRNRLFREALMHVDATFAESCSEAMYAFAPPYDILFLDHDLGGRQFVDTGDTNTGSAFAQWLPVTEELCHVIIHSYNPTGALYMESVLTRKGYTVERVPFGPTVLNHCKQLA